MLGRYLSATAPSGAVILGTSRSTWYPVSPSLDIRSLDLTDEALSRALLEELEPDAIIHCAAEGSVDKVERNPTLYRALNVYLPEFLAQWTVERHARFIHLSSNAVFGETELPHDDYDPHSPMNEYGKLKAEAEDRIMAINPRTAIVRPIFLYGWNPPQARVNPAAGWISALRTGQKIRVVEDVFTQPLAAADCAELIWKLVESEFSGPINISGGTTLSLCEFALLVADVFGLDAALVERARKADFKELAPRPSKTEFTLRRLHTELTFFPLDPRGGLDAMRIVEGA